MLVYESTSRHAQPCCRQNTQRLHRALPFLSRRLHCFGTPLMLRHHHHNKNPLLPLLLQTLLVSFLQRTNPYRHCLLLYSLPFFSPFASRCLLHGTFSRLLQTGLANIRIPHLFLRCAIATHPERSIPPSPLVPPQLLSHPFSPQVEKRGCHGMDLLAKEIFCVICSFSYCGNN